MTWTEPASDGGSAITGYRVQWKEAADSWDTPADLSEAAVTGTSHIITGLTGGAEYSVRVLAINDLGESLPSEDGSGTPRETVPPELSGASVDGAALTLAFGDDLTETPLPAVNTFTVTVGQEARGVDSLEITGSSVTLTLALAVTSSDQVSVSYTVPTDAAAARLEDLSGNPAASFADQSVTNNTAAEQQQNSPARGGPAISGTVQVGETLTASTSAISDTDGLTKVSYAYQWTANDGNSDSDIAGATARTYTLTAADVGKTIKVKVTFTDDAGIEESLPSAATAAVAANVPGAPARPSVSVIDTGKLDLSWEAPETDGGSAVIGYKVQWKEAAGSWDTPEDVSEAAATGTSHTITGLTGGVEYSVRVSAVNSVGDGAPSPEATGTPTAGDSASGSKGAQGTPAEGLPAITGEPTVGETLRADNSGISDKDGMKKAVFTYQWMAGGADIDGATGASYTLTDGEEGLAVQVWVSFTDDAGNPEAVTSVGTAAVSPANTPASGVPAITGILRDGETLAADTSGSPTRIGWTTPFSPTAGWRAATDIDGATGSTYTLTADEVGAAISVWVSFTDDAGNPEAVTSAPTEAVAPKPPLTAQFLDTPGSHDGQSEFTFELRFSETPRRGFSYETLRDHALTVTGGEVVRARRLEPGKNVRWEITVRPDSNDAVTIVLPATEDCAADGAICTGDGRMLSERVELTVSGPGG